MSTYRQVSYKRIFFLILSIPLTAIILGYRASAAGPTTISSCAELAAIDDTPTNVSDTYTLTKDIDCAGTTLEPLIWGATPFSGTFDGAGYEIINIDINTPLINNVGLFSSTNGATITNLTLVGPTVEGYDYVGALAGRIIGGSLTNITVSGATITAKDDRAGGVSATIDSNTITNVAVLDSTITSIDNTAGGVAGSINTSTVTNVSVDNSTITSGGYEAGGVAGFIGSSTISYAHTDVIVSAAEYNAGGIAGEGDSLSIYRSSSKGSVTATGSSAGGLIGFTDGDAIDQSFSTSDVTGNGDIGGLVGETESDTLTITDSYARGNLIDTSTLGTNHCAGIGGNLYDGVVEAYRVYYAGYAECRGVSEPHRGLAGGQYDDVDFYDSFWDLKGGLNDVDAGASIMLFGASAGKTTAAMKDISTFTTNPALTTPWNFNGVWLINPDLNEGYPYLGWQTFPAPDDADGIDKSVEDAAPNSGDANNDGTPDSEQPKVTSLLNSITASYTVLESSTCAANNAVSVMAESEDSAKNDANFDYPVGLLNFTLTGCVIGGTETITQYHYGANYDNPSSLILRKYDPSDSSYITIDSAVFAEVTIGGELALKVVYQVADGGIYDQDGIADGTIVDPAGVALGVATTTETQDSVPTETEAELLAETGSEVFLLPLAGLMLMSLTSVLFYSSEIKISRKS